MTPRTKNGVTATMYGLKLITAFIVVAKTFLVDQDAWPVLVTPQLIDGVMQQVHGRELIIAAIARILNV